MISFMIHFQLIKDVTASHCCTLQEKHDVKKICHNSPKHYLCGGVF